MAGHTPWAQIRDRRGPKSPEQTLAEEAIYRALSEAQRLAEICVERGIAQPEESDASGTRRAAMAPIDPRADLYLATLQESVAELGGELVLIARFAGGDVAIPLPEIAPVEAPVPATASGE